VVSGECWLSVEAVPDAVRLKTGDCFVLPIRIAGGAWSIAVAAVRWSSRETHPARCCRSANHEFAALDDHADAEGNLDASYTISFARIRVGDLAATVVFGDKEYAISARGRAGGVMTLLIGHDTINRWRSLLHRARHRQGRSSRADNFYI
jgi:hypothetical protein